jgi:hypothetical protein
MTALVWDAVGQRFYETGVDHGVLYIPNPSGVYDTGYAWNGLTTVTESPTGAEVTPTYADNIKYLSLISLEEFEGTIEAYTYPDAFAACDGSAEPETGVLVGQQPRQTFGFSYRTRLGNDVEKEEYGYKLHLVYGALASPSEKAFATISDSPEAIDFSWDFTTTPVPVTGLKPTATLVIDSTKVAPADLAELEAFLYGTVGTDPSLPSPDAVIAIFAGALTVATPTTPTFNGTTDVITIPSVTGVVYYNGSTGVTYTSGAQPAIVAITIVKARPVTGYKFPAIVDDEWVFDPA